MAFIYGWVLLLVTQTGGMAAVAVTFSHYYREITGLSAGDGPIAAATLLGLTAINCFGVRAGSNVQSALMLLKAAAIAAMVVAGIAWGGGAMHPLPLLDRPVSLGLGSAIGAAMIPVAFAYGGWQTASFVAGEMRDPRRDLSRGLVMGVIGVVVLYLAVNFVCVRVLGPEGLAATRIPASSVMRKALGERGARWIAFGIAVSTLGFLSQGILTAPRVYYAMARDGLFFKSVGWLSPKTAVPVVAIVLQGVTATVIALSGRYEQILNYVISVDFISFGLTAASLFVFRRRQPISTPETLSGARSPLHHSSFCPGLRRYRHYHDSYFSGELRHRSDYSAGRHPGIFVLEPQCAADSGATRPMRHRYSDYMHWAKMHSHARFNLATSGVASFPLRDLPVTIEQLEINGDSAYGYAPLQQAIANKCAVDPDCVVAAAGTSMANHLAMATLLDPGDEVLLEEPTYELLTSTLLYLGATIKRFARSEESGYALNPAEVRRVITPKTKLIVLTNLHNPSSVLAPESVLREVGDLARSVRAHVLVDEVYLDAVYTDTPRSSYHLGPEFVVTASLTKVYGLSGLRCGWILAQPDLARTMWRLNDLFASIPAHPAELLSVVAFQNLDRIRERGPQDR